MSIRNIFNRIVYFNFLNVLDEKVYSGKKTLTETFICKIESNGKIVGKIQRPKSNLIEISFPSTPNYRHKALVLALALFCFTTSGGGGVVFPMII